MRAGSQEALKDIVRTLASILGEESSQSSQQRNDTIGLGYLKNLAAVLRIDGVGDVESERLVRKLLQ